MKTLVMKFGGTSVGNAGAIRQTADIIRSAHTDWPRLVIVASAMSGVTDALLKGAHTAADGDAATFRLIARDLRNKHFAALDDLLKDSALLPKPRGVVCNHFAGVALQPGRGLDFDVEAVALVQAEAGNGLQRGQGFARKAW